MASLSFSFKGFFFSFFLNSVPMSSSRAISAPSPRRGPIFTILVYPPGLSLKRGPSSSKSFFTTAFLKTNLIALRLAWRVFLLPKVIIFSARGLAALAKDVLIRSFSRKEVTRLRNRARRCAVSCPSFFPLARCLMIYSDSGPGWRKPYESRSSLTVLKEAGLKLSGLLAPGK